jgi:hypothetical protein
MLKRKGQQELLNMTMAPFGLSHVAAHDGLWMMGSARSVTVKVQKKHAAGWPYQSTSLLRDVGGRGQPSP